MVLWCCFWSVWCSVFSASDVTTGMWHPACAVAVACPPYCGAEFLSWGIVRWQRQLLGSAAITSRSLRMRAKDRPSDVGSRRKHRRGAPTGHFGSRLLRIGRRSDKARRPAFANKFRRVMQLVATKRAKPEWIGFRHYPPARLQWA